MSRHTRALGIVFVLAWLAGGCAARSREAALVADLAERLRLAHAAADRGCYTCLREAFDLATAVEQASPRFADARHLVFTTTVLLALRERELGLVGRGDLQHARTLAAGPAEALTLEAAESVPQADQGPFRERWDDIRSGRERTAQRLATWRASLGTGDVTARYALLSVECAFPDVSGLSREQLPPEAPGEPPALVWRRATCLGRDLDALQALVVREPAFAEASYLLGVQSLMLGRLVEAETRVSAALSAIPGWPGAAITLGNIRLALERFAASREAFDAALALVPEHPTARLGKLQAFSYEGAHGEALAVADAMIARGTWLVGDAHYWRAWNLARLERFDEAEASITEAKRLLVNAAVFKLAGVIAFRRGRLDAARGELTAARERAPDDCEVPGYEGYVESAAQKWEQAGMAFATAATCRAREAADAASRLARLSGDTSSEPASIERCRRDIVTAREELGAAHFRAANALAAAGRLDDARAHAAAALEHPEWADKARALLATLDRRPLPEP